MSGNDVYLPPGVLYAASAPCVIRTILGSCVAVCLWSPRLRVGGMNHYLLPRGGGVEASMRCGETALALLHARLRALGSDGRDLCARIYGGASVLSGMNKASQLGADNVEVARRFVSQHAIPVLEEDVLGRLARRVVFDVASGKADVTCLRGA